MIYKTYPATKALIAKQIKGNSIDLIGWLWCTLVGNSVLLIPSKSKDTDFHWFSEPPSAIP